jgi:putative Mg2+ transporter-C (MgtC) family protein
MVVELTSAAVEPIARLIVAAILGAVVGLERQLTNKPVGLRTYMLVSLGAALFTVISTLEFQGDSARIAGGIVTGIGFLGAGSIIATRGQVHGVTTAASLWAVAGVGLALGTGAYFIAITATVAILLILELGRVQRLVGLGKKR